MLILAAQFKLGVIKYIYIYIYIYICFYTRIRYVMQIKIPGYIKTKPNQIKPVKIMISTNTHYINKHAQLEILNISSAKMVIHDSICHNYYDNNYDNYYDIFKI